MSRRGGALLRAAGGLAVVVALLWWLGPGPFLQGLRSLDGAAVALAMLLGAVTTAAAAWRWTVVAGGLGVRIPLPRAVAACYQSQFLNTMLPAGVLGDVHRAIENGRDNGDLGRGVRAVVWERTAGQAAQVMLASAIFLALPSPLPPVVPVLLAVAMMVAVAVVIGGAARRPESTAWPARLLRVIRSDLRDAVLARGVWPRVGAASVVVVAGHLATFLIAAHSVDPAAGVWRVLPLAMLVLLAAALPLNVAGWGPREGVAAWAFGAAGLGTDRGAAVATAYGVLVIASCLPGAVILVVTRWRRARRVPEAGVAGRRPQGASGRTEVGCG